VDGKTVEAAPGEMIIAAAERGGTYIPRFCYHPRMRSVGMCRMCLVEVVGPRGPQLQPACFVPVAEGQEIITDSPNVKKAQDGVLELLLVNHPLDCPVCDRGGECPLQDHTLGFGPGESRFVEEKRHWEKPIALSELVALDRERCIQCDRCTRFADEVAGDPLIEFVGRGAETEVNTFPDQPFASYFSGNVVQLCPVGALTASPYRFAARPWDLDQVESTCTSCSVGCRVALQSTTDRVVRKLGIDVDPVNQGWLCDKGRFDYESAESPERYRSPLVRRGDELVETTWSEALDLAADGLTKAVERDGGAGVAVIGGARGTNEDAYAWSKLARTVLRTDNVDCQLGDGLPAEAVLGLPRATIDEACAADAVVLLGADVKEELPVLYLRLRGAAVAGRTTLHEISPTATGLTRYTATSTRHVPGDSLGAVRELLASGALTGAESVVCLLGRSSVAETPEVAVAAAAALLAAVPGVTFLSGLRRANVHGALDMGLAPGLLPGRVGLDEGRAWFTECWGELPAESGLDTRGILEHAAAGRLSALVLLGADPLADFPDRDLARRALAGTGFVVAVDTLPSASSRQADVVLPARMAGEEAGTTTNLEGRVSRVFQKVTPPGTAWADWMIAVEVAERFGFDLGLESAEQITAEIAAVAPAYAGVTSERLAATLDGVLAGRADPDEGPSAEATALPAPSAGEAPEVHAAAASPAGAVPAGADAATREDPSADGDDQPSADDPEAGDPTDADTEPPALVPSLLTFQPPASPPTVPVADRYSLRLVSHRRLYDDGVLVRHARSLAPLTDERAAAIGINPGDLERLGIGDGDQVRVSSSRTALTLTTHATEQVPRGTAFLAFAQAGPGAADLIDIASPVTEIRVETL
ncbi:MAG TPA: NADH-quinone oxidoreductase subunit NuoG, partial [Acidimicrobiales bacterium]